MHKYKIGLEVHVQIDTKYKLFSGSKNDFNNDENINIDIFDLAVPGTYPRINEEAISKAYILAKLLNCEMPELLVFDRKHYFYPDLPSGYQITQYEYPIGINGSYKVINNKKIKILDIHIECDASKLKRYDQKLHIDYNRCNVPLVEIVTDCVFEDYNQIEEFIMLLLNDLKENKISKAKLEHGNIRFDVNISREINKDLYTCRFEIKNINFPKGIKKSIEFAKLKLLNSDHNDEDMTFNYDDDNIIPSRKKCNKHQYMYLREYTLAPVKLDLFKPKDININYTINKFNSITMQLPNLDKKIIINFICDTKLYNIMLSILENCNYDNKFKHNAIHFISENKALIEEFSDRIEEVKLILLQGCDILKNRKSTKVNVITAIKNIICNNMIVNLEEYLERNNMLIKELTVSENIIMEIIIENFGTIEKFINADNRAFNFLVGYIIKKLQLSPVIIKEILTKIKNNYNEQKE